VLPHGQPFATIVTKSYPDEEPDPVLDRPGSFRLNVEVGRARIAELVPAGAPVEPDAWRLPPVYGSLGWVSVVNPGERPASSVREVLVRAHAAARARRERREDVGS
jgi:hypothetical protein